MKLKRGAKIESYVPTAPMADIAFLLIVFFMVTSSFPVDRTMVKLPRAELRLNIEDKEAAYITVFSDASIGGQTTIKVTDGKDKSSKFDTPEVFPVTLLENWLYLLMDKSPNKLIILKIDRNIRYEFVDSVMESIKSTGAVKNIVFLSGATGKQKQ